MQLTFKKVRDVSFLFLLNANCDSLWVGRSVMVFSCSFTVHHLWRPGCQGAWKVGICQSCCMSEDSDKADCMEIRRDYPVEYPAKMLLLLKTAPLPQPHKFLGRLPLCSGNLPAHCLLQLRCCWSHQSSSHSLAAKIAPHLHVMQPSDRRHTRGPIMCCVILLPDGCLWRVHVAAQQDFWRCLLTCDIGRRQQGD